MRRFDLALAVFISLALHAALFLVFGSYEEAQVRFEPGVSAVTLNIMPSVATRASTPEPQPPPPPPVVEAPKPPPEPQPVVQPPEPPPAPEPIPLPPLPPEAPPPVAQQPAPAQPQPGAPPAPAPKPAAVAPAAPPAKQAPTVSTEPAAVDSADANADLRPHGVSAPASALNLTQPEYPFYSRRHGEEGTVVVEVEIQSSDRAGRIEVVHSSGHSRLDRAAVDALKKAHYKAARRAGVPVTTTKRFSFTFRLEGTESE